MSGSIHIFLKEARLKKGLTQGQAAKELGLTSPQYISNIERGLCPASLETILKLIEVYDLKPAKLVELMTQDFKYNLEQKLVAKKGKSK